MGTSLANVCVLNHTHTPTQCTARLERVAIKHSALHNIGRTPGLAEENVVDRGTNQNVLSLQDGGAVVLETK